MKPYKMLAVMLATCAVMTAWPLLASAQKNGEPPQIKESAGPSEESKGKIEAYKQDMEKELRAIDRKT